MNDRYLYRAKSTDNKVKEQCRTCGKFQEKRCRLGKMPIATDIVTEKARKKCGDYQRVSITQAAKEPADAAGIDINTIR
ncbi:MAG: hypothetical protein MR430_10470 [Lachnospiraceae bacterium]|nr:hypothetical protein [Lachnospiraceae bacterium]